MELQLYIEKATKLIQLSCFGCRNNCPSFRDHTCWTDSPEYYYREALDQLLSENNITQEFFNQKLKELVDGSKND